MSKRRNYKQERELEKSLSLLILLLVAAQSIPTKGVASDKVIKTDIRYRHERINEADKNYTRNLQKIRARLSINANVSENFSILFRLASGSDDPISTNQTLTNGFSTKPIMLDLAYFEYHPVSLKGVCFRAGKMKVPFYKVGNNELIWDADLNPEGLSFNYNPHKGSLNLFVHTGYFWVEERKTSDDAMLIGVQGGLRSKFSKSRSISVGTGYYNYTATKGEATFFNSSMSFGNTVDSRKNYICDFNELEFFTELKAKVGNIPFSVFGNYVKNIAANSSNKGWLVGFSGKLKSFDFRYDYRKLEKDAVVGIFTNSDFIGGGTNGKGHVLGISVPIGENAKAGITYFLNKKGFENGESYNRLQVDILISKFL